MRITNTMTTNQLLLNLNKNMTSLNILQYQASTGNKIQFASDNPIVAARALKFRTNIAETEQYISNVSQGTSWLNTSANAVTNVLEALVNSGETSVRSLLVSGANGTNTVEDSKIYANQLQETLNEVLSELNVSYAGRYVFSGYKTDEKAVFDSDFPGKEMYINENFSFSDIEDDHRVYVKVDQLINVNDGYVPTPVPSGLAIDDTAMPQEVSVHRIKLAYDVGITGITGFGTAPVNTTNSQTDGDAYFPKPGTINYLEDTGELIIADDVYQTIQAETKANQALADSVSKAALEFLQASEKNNTAAGAAAAKTKADDLVTLLNSIPTTGIVDKDSYGKLTEAIAAATAAQTKAADLVTKYSSMSIPPTLIEEKEKNELMYAAREAAEVANNASQNLSSVLTQVQVAYKKTGFKKGDINPKVYFNCKEDLGGGDWKKYDMLDQAMMYEFGTNNKIQINILAKDMMTTSLINDLRDAISFVENISFSDREKLVADYKSQGYDDEKSAELADKQLQEEEKFYKDMIETRYTTLIGKLDNHATTISKENTSIGAKLNRLELISNRLQDDRINYEDLKSENENVDIGETYIRYQSMQTVYQSALQMGASIMQMSLLNYI